MIALLLTALALLLAPGGAAAAKRKTAEFVRSDSLPWPAGTERLRFENLEGIILIRGTLTGRADVDTTGPLALDTGAGYLALDRDLAIILGVADSASEAEAVDLAPRALPRLVLGGWTLEQVRPVLTVDGEIVRRVSDRPVLGLLGQKPFEGRTLWLDYREQVLAVLPAPPGENAELKVPDTVRVDPDTALARSRARLARLLTARAFPIPFNLAGDGKILVRGLVSDPFPPSASRPLNLIVDTGATKCVLFEDALAPSVQYADRWPALRGLSAPTLIGAAEARIARIPTFELETADGRCLVDDVDVGVIRSALSQVLSRVTRATIHGLVGYSFLKRFRVAVDYPNQVMWLDPIPRYQEDRPFEYCHVGLQLERREGAVVVVGVADESPAARAGIARGDEVVAMDGVDARGQDLVALTRRMEGQPGRPLTIVIRRDAVERTVRLVRRRLL